VVEQHNSGNTDFEYLHVYSKNFAIKFFLPRDAAQNDV